jgi:hypothetical protein
VSVRTLSGIQESIKFPLPKGLRMDGVVPEAGEEV